MLPGFQEKQALDIALYTAYNPTKLREIPQQQGRNENIQCITLAQ